MAHDLAWTWWPKAPKPIQTRSMLYQLGCEYRQGFAFGDRWTPTLRCGY